jgi:hypothetical protein
MIHMLCSVGPHQDSVRKINLDADFARTLQALDDKGKDIDLVKDAERYRATRVSSQCNVDAVAVY